MTPPRYYASEEEFQLLRAKIKMSACPHCRGVGTLNLHGHLRGYAEQGGNTPVHRGRRLFCSNRRHRSGCGITVSLWLAGFLRNHILTLPTLWLFLAGILAGPTQAAAFRRTASALHPTTLYRAFRKVRQAQSRLRTHLYRLIKPPERPPSASPMADTLAHLQAAFPHARCPPADYQLRFQHAFPA
jgi:hypothetical protein